MPRRPLRRAAVLAAVTPLALTAALAANPAQAALRPARTTVPGSVPSWARSSADRGAAASTDQLSARVYLAPRDQAGLTALVAQVSDPKSSSYAHYLTPAQYRARFAPTADQISAVKSWLSSDGLTVTAANEHYVAVSGTVASAEKAFGTDLRLYDRDGQVLRAPASQVQVPSSLGGSVLAVTGLDSASHVATPSVQPPFPPPDGFVSAKPCSAYYGEKTATDQPSAFGTKEPYAVCGYTPTQLRGAYGATASGLTGAGQTVAITDAYQAGTLQQDVREYVSRNDPSSTWADGQLTEVSAAPYTRQSLCGSNGWYGEETLDVEAVHAMAPKANVVYVAAQNCYDDSFIDAFHKIVDNKLATIVTNSWSDLESNETPAYTAAYEQVFQQGAVEGIGFYFSSGDDGDETINGVPKTVDYPASDPYATGVGGTSLAVNANNGYQFETGWGTVRANKTSDGSAWDLANSYFVYGAGGGVSSLFAQPAYQKGVTDSVSSTMRTVPDISADADPNTGMLVGETQTFTKQSRGTSSSAYYAEYRIGGTSLASPLIAGLQALAQQKAGHSLGFANPAIYQRFSTGVFHDVTDPSTNAPIANVRADYVNGVDDTNGVSYSLRIFGRDSSLHATAGYDDVTGVGSPTLAYLLSY